MGNKIDLIGQRFGNLIIIGPAQKPEGTSYTCAFWKCKCDCGNIKNFPSSSLRNGKTTHCGCKKKENLEKRFTIDITGKKFGHLTVLERVSTPEHCTSSGAYFKCKCDCGNEKIIMGKSLRNGSTKTCGCHYDKITNLTGKRFGKLVVEKIDNSVENRGNGANWICRCDCGKYISVTSTNLLRGQQSCGCLVSKGEEKIRQILLENNILFKTQYSFSDLRGEQGGLLRFDFAIFNSKKQLSYLIEFQGEQHYLKSSKYFDISLQKYDKLKKEYCEKSNIPLIIIPYYKLNNLTLEDLKI